MLEISKIRWKNLLSYGDTYTEVTFDADTTLIVGANSAGKSTLCEALCFVFYGKAFRNVNKPHLVNSINGQECVVEVFFNTNGKSYRVVRGIRPNIFEVWEDGKQIHFTADAKDFQTIFETQIVQMSYKAFVQIVILGKANYSPFMTLPAAERRKVIEDLLDLGVFSVMNKYLGEEKARNKESIRDVDARLSVLTVELEEKEKAYNRLASQSALLRNALLQKIEDAKTAVQECEAELNVINSNYEIAQKAHQANEEKNQKHIAILSAIDAIEKKLARMKEKSNPVCPACGQAKQVKPEENNVTTKRLELEQGLAKLLERSNGLIHTMTEFDKTAMTRCANTQYEARHRLEHASRQLRKLEDEERQYTGGTNELELTNEITEVKTKIDAVGMSRAKLIDARDIIDLAGAMLKDDGIKQRIISRYIPVMNASVQKYLRALSLPIQFSINDDFSENIVSPNMINLGFNSFSEGQKARIELALLFAWRDLSKTRNSSATNVLILDEVFDGSLDTEGNEDLMNIINEFSSSKIVVISHKPEAYIEKFKRVLQVKKNSGFSAMEEIVT